jgi:hypothetical protein
MSAILAIVDGPKHKIPLALNLKETQSRYVDLDWVRLKISVTSLFEKEQIYTESDRYSIHIF